MLPKMFSEAICMSLTDPIEMSGKSETASTEGRNNSSKNIIHNDELILNLREYLIFGMGVDSSRV